MNMRALGASVSTASNWVSLLSNDLIPLFWSAPLPNDFRIFDLRGVELSAPPPAQQRYHRTSDTLRFPTPRLQILLRLHVHEPLKLRDLLPHIPRDEEQDARGDRSLVWRYECEDDAESYGGYWDQ